MPELKKVEILRGRENKRMEKKHVNDTINVILHIGMRLEAIGGSDAPAANFEASDYPLSLQLLQRHVLMISSKIHVPLITSSPSSNWSN